MCNGRYLTAGADDSNLGQLLETSAAVGRRRAPPRRQIRPLGRLRLLAGAAADSVRAAEFPAWRGGALRVRAAASAGARELVERPVENAGSTGLPGVAAGRTRTRGNAVRESAMARRRATIAAATTKAPTASSPPTRLRREPTTAAMRSPTQGKYEEAIAAYDATLRANPHDEDAAFNKALLEKLRDKKQSGENDNNESQRNRDQAQSDQSREQNSSGNPNQEESQSRSERAGEQAPGNEAAEVRSGTSAAERRREAADGRARSPARRTTRRARAMAAARARRPVRPAAAQIPVRDERAAAQRRAGSARPGADLVKAALIALLGAAAPLDGARAIRCERRHHDDFRSRHAPPDAARRWHESHVEPRLRSA